LEAVLQAITCTGTDNKNQPNQHKKRKYNNILPTYTCKRITN